MAITAATVTGVTTGAPSSGTVDTLGPAFQEGCGGQTPAAVPEAFPTVNVRGDEPDATAVPADGELLLYAYGYDTPVQLGRQLAATLDAALDEQGYDGTVAVVEWRAEPGIEGDGGAQGEAFAASEAQADDDGAGLGVLSALAGLGIGGYLASRRQRDG